MHCYCFVENKGGGGWLVAGDCEKGGRSTRCILFSVNLGLVFGRLFIEDTYGGDSDAGGIITVVIWSSTEIARVPLINFAVICGCWWVVFGKGNKQFLMTSRFLKGT